MPEGRGFRESNITCHQPLKHFIVSDIDVCAGLKESLHHGEMTFIGSRNECGPSILGKMGAENKLKVIFGIFDVLRLIVFHR